MAGLHETPAHGERVLAIPGSRYQNVGPRSRACPVAAIWEQGVEVELRPRSERECRGLNLALASEYGLAACIVPVTSLRSPMSRQLVRAGGRTYIKSIPPMAGSERRNADLSRRI